MSTPAESSREATLRSRVIWSFWTIILFLGFPTWWATTSIYRATLPTELMLEKHADLWYSIPICLQSPSIPLATLVQLAAKTQSLATGPQGLFKFQVVAQGQCRFDHTSTVFELDTGVGKEINYSSKTSSFRIEVIKGDITGGATRLSDYLQSAFLEEHASIAYQLFTSDRNNEKIQAFVQSLPQDLLNTIQKSANRAFKPSSDYHLTFSLFAAGPSPSQWDIQHLLDTYIQPIVHALSATSNFSVTSQLQLYSAFSPAVQPVRGEVEWRLRREDLTSFVNTAEWPLSPSIGNGPTFNFIAYVPSQSRSPLVLEDSPSNSWLVPQWGAISILNPPLMDTESELGFKALPETLDFDALVPAFTNFRTYLLQLLGIPQMPQLPLPERLKSFQRLSALSLYIRTSSNLGSLARLAQHLSSIPIPKHVLRYVETSLGQLTTFRQCLTPTASGSFWTTSLHSVRTAFTDSEKAFFDKSMVGQVYFPDEHKLAVYLPLMGPVAPPLVVGLLKELRSYAARRKL